MSIATSAPYLGGKIIALRAEREPTYSFAVKLREVESALRALTLPNSVTVEYVPQYEFHIT